MIRAASTSRRWPVKPKKSRDRIQPMTDRDIEAPALLVFRQHGRSSSYFARGRAETLRDEGAHAGAETWEKIAAIVEEWERDEPGPGESVN